MMDIQMNQVTISDGVMVNGNIVKYSDGTVLPPCPSKGHNTTVIDKKVYIDGYEFKKGKWRRTLKALWYAVT